MSGTAVRPGTARIPEALISALETRLGDRVSTAAAVREPHRRDESLHAPQAPDAVAFPASSEDVRAIVSLCARYRVPVISFGAVRSIHRASIHTFHSACPWLARPERCSSNSRRT